MLGLRLLTAAVAIPLLLLVLWLGHPWLGVLVSTVVLLAAVEVGELLRRSGIAPATGVIAVFGVGAVAVIATLPLAGDWLFVGWLVLLVVASATAGLTRSDGRAAIEAWLGTLAGSAYVAMLAFLLLIPLAVRSDGASGPLAEWLDAGRAWLLIVVLVVWTCDSAAYAVGRIWGRGSFFNHLSPNKTWSGAIGGGAAAVLAGGLLGWGVGRPLEGLGLGLLVSFAAPIGDLAQSALKRAAQVKDSGRLFPGHGGMLDRIDAFMLVAPLAWLYLVIVGLA